MSSSQGREKNKLSKVFYFVRVSLGSFGRTGRVSCFRVVTNFGVPRGWSFRMFPIEYQFLTSLFLMFLFHLKSSLFQVSLPSPKPLP